MGNIDEKLDVLATPAYQKIMKKNRTKKRNANIKQFIVFIIKDICVPIGVSIITTLIVGGL